MSGKLSEWKTRVSAQNPILNPDYNEEKKNQPKKGISRTIYDPYNLNK
nr:hypothetical protein [uncultured Pedobacter sp.]